MEGVLANLGEKLRAGVPDNFQYVESRNEFSNPEVTPAADIPEFSWREPDEEGLVQFLCREKEFDEKRVRNAVQKIRAARKNSQGRIDGFFSVIKRPAEENVAAAGKKAKVSAATDKAKKSLMKKK